MVSAAPAATATPAPAKAKPKQAGQAEVHGGAAAAPRRAAVTTLSGLGYRPVTLKTYDPDHVLRVLVGKGEGGQRAFFFVGARYLGNDAADDSESIADRPRRQPLRRARLPDLQDGRQGLLPERREGARAVPLGRQDARPADGDPAVGCGPRRGPRCRRRGVSARCVRLL